MHSRREHVRVKAKAYGCRLRLGLALLLQCLLLSCSTVQAPVHHGPMLTATSDELLDVLQNRRAALHTLKGLFSAQIQGPGIPITQTIHGTMLFQDPHRLRVKGFTRFGGALFDFSLGQNRYVLSLPRDGKVLYGSMDELRDDPEIQRPIMLTVLAMSGVVGIETKATSEHAILLEIQDQYLLEINELGQDGSSGMIPNRRLWFDRENLYVVKEERIGPRGALEALLQLDDFRLSVPPVFVAQSDTGKGKLMMPFHVKAEDGQGDGKISVKFSELQPNVAVTGEDFSLPDSALPR